MSLHYILDGYNIIKQSDFASRKVLKDAREDLIRFIIEKKPCGSANNKVSVVFDGTADGFNFYRTESKFPEVIFSHNCSADTKIKKMVEASGNPRRIVVVSDDKEIKFFVKSCAAQCMDVAAFVDKGLPVPKPRRDPPKIELSYSQAARINEELAKIWLK
jgi:predicted RNA-binding protein with PIN domain